MGRLWKEFFLNTALEKETVHSEEEWIKVVQDHGGNFSRLKRLMSRRDTDGHITFGEGFGFNQLPTLEQWAEENNPRMFPG